MKLSGHYIRLTPFGRRLAIGVILVVAVVVVGVLAHISPAFASLLNLEQARMGAGNSLPTWF
jgi:hypothetical protein